MKDGKLGVALVGLGKYSEGLRKGMLFSSIIKTNFMSQAFVRESDEQWLHDVTPTMNALMVYLTRENNGIRVYEQKAAVHPKTGKEVFYMSNGLSYTKDDEGRWSVA